MDGFGQKIRDIRESQNLFLRQVAAAIEIDQALLSKIERGDRIATKSQVISLAIFFKIPELKLLTLWLGEKIAYEIKDEVIASDALKVAEKKIHYLKRSQKNTINV